MSDSLKRINQLETKRSLKDITEAFSDFAARLKSNSSNFILPQPVLSKRLAVLGDVLRYDFHSPVTQVCDACAQSEASEHVERIHRGEYAASLEVRGDSIALRFLYSHISTTPLPYV